MTLIAFIPPTRYAFRIPQQRFWRWITAAAIIAPLAACSGGVASTPTLAPAAAPAVAPAPTQVPALAPTATPRTGLLLNEPESFEGYTLISPKDSLGSYLIDHHGRVVHTWTLGSPSLASEARLLDNGNLLGHYHREIDPDGNVVWEYRYPQHHDILKLPNGHVLFLSYAFVSREEAIALGANPDALSCSSVRGTRIVEARPAGPESADIVWKWSVFDHLIQDFDPTKPNYGVVADRPERIDLNYTIAKERCKHKGTNRAYFDWIHANALDYNAELDQIMVTVRNFSEIWIIDRSATTEEAAGSSGGNAGKGGDLLYRWGNPRAHRAGTPADQRLFFPHAAHWIPEGSPGAGNVLIFNNGWEYPGFEREYSSVDEIALPSDGYNYRRDAGAVYGPSESVWTYAAEPVDSFYAPARSNAQRLPNGNTLIADGFANRNRVFEVTREGKVVWDFVYPVAAASAGINRAYRYSPDYPGLRYLELDAAPTDLLNAAAGEPLARSAFDVYAADGYLVYAKEQCGPDDLAHLFYLHILPERADDPQEMRRRREYEEVDVGTSLNIDLHASLSDGKCAARIPMPDYPVAAARTGQFGPAGELWSAEFSMRDVR